MDPLVEGLEPHQADRAEQGDRGPEDEQEGDDQRHPQRKFPEPAHSMTSPRMRNLASAAVETKPSSAITSAISK